MTTSTLSNFWNKDQLMEAHFEHGEFYNFEPEHSLLRSLEKLQFDPDEEVFLNNLTKGSSASLGDLPTENPSDEDDLEELFPKTITSPSSNERTLNPNSNIYYGYLTNASKGSALEASRSAPLLTKDDFWPATTPPTTPILANAQLRTESVDSAPICKFDPFCLRSNCYFYHSSQEQKLTKDSLNPRQSQSSYTRFTCPKPNPAGGSMSLSSLPEHTQRLIQLGVYDPPPRNPKFTISIVTTPKKLRKRRGKGRGKKRNSEVFPGAPSSSWFSSTQGV